MFNFSTSHRFYFRNTFVAVFKFNMLKNYLMLISLFICGIGYSQVGIGTSTPQNSSILDVKSTNKGILIPNVSLTNTTTFSLEGSKSIAEQFAANSMLVYNLSKVNDVTEGYYYWSQANTSTPGLWVKIMNGKEDTLVAKNGLSVKENKNIVLGGTLSEPTTITTSKDNTLAIKDLHKTDNLKENVIVSSTDGVLKTTNSVLPRVFYMPSILIDASSPATGKTINLYEQYFNQFASPKVRSEGANPSIPYYTKEQLYYYVTYYDMNVFNIVSIDEFGVMTFDIIGTPTYSSFINVVFVVK